MSYALKFAPDAALKVAREKAKAEFVTVKQTVVSGTSKSPIGSFLVDLKTQSGPQKVHGPR